MIAGIWHGKTPAEKTKDYLEFLKIKGTTDYKNTAGNLGIEILMRKGHNISHFLLIMHWDSFESIKKFESENYENPVYYPDDNESLLEFEPTVIHYKIK